MISGIVLVGMVEIRNATSLKALAKLGSNEFGLHMQKATCHKFCPAIQQVAEKL